MAIYWVDPYIDTPKGGIHGTTSTSTRDGAYATPFGLAEMFHSSKIASLNGTTLATGDEIRLKGQALADFYFNIGTTGNTVDITSVTGAALNYASSDEQYVATYKTALAATGDTKPSIIIHDPGLMGTNKIILSTGQTTFPTTTNQVPQLQSINNNIASWTDAKVGIDVNDNVKVAFVDPVYVFDYSTVFSGANPTNAFNFNVTGITVTDGWLSSSARGGFTVLPIIVSGSASINADWWCNSTGFDQTFDMPNTFINWYKPTSSYISGLKHRQWFYGMGENGFNLGQFGHTTNSPWNYIYIDSTTKNTANENPCVTWGNLMNGHYQLWAGAGPTTFADWPVIRVSNMFSGSGPYMSQTRMKLEYGNCFFYRSYTGTAMFWNVTTQGKFTILPNAHIFGFQNTNSLLKDTYQYGVVVPASATNFADNVANYLGQPSTTGGPIFSGISLASEYFADNVNANRVKLSPASWASTKPMQMSSGPSALASYNYGLWNNSFGILDCGGADYKNTNANLLLISSGYTGLSQFSNQNAHFAGNTYDGKPLALWAKVSLTTGAGVPALLSYNNAAGDMVVMLSSYATNNVSHAKSFQLQLPDLSSATSLQTTFTITRSSASLAVPTANGYFIKSDTSGESSDAAFQTSTSNNVITYTLTATNLDANARFMGMKVNINTGIGKAVADTYTISTPTFVVA